MMRSDDAIQPINETKKRPQDNPALIVSYHLRFLAQWTRLPKLFHAFRTMSLPLYF